MIINVKKNFAGLAFAGVIAFSPVSTLRNIPARIGSDAARLNIRTEIASLSARPKLQAAIHDIKNSRATVNGQVTAVGSATITVNNNGTNVQVDIGSNTHFRRKFWGTSSLSEISVGDTVQVIGKWTSTADTEVTAVLIRDISIQKRNGVFFGTVTSLTSNGFVVNTIHRDSETVTIGSAKIVDRKGNTLTASQIQVNDKIRVRGMWDSNLKTITEVTEIKDFSLPVQTSVSPTPTATP
jgi:hypothetical protein